MQPFVERKLAALEPRPHRDRKRLATFVALVDARAGARPFELADPPSIAVAAMRAHGACRPEKLLEVLPSRALVFVNVFAAAHS